VRVYVVAVLVMVMVAPSGESLPNAQLTLTGSNPVRATMKDL
jgi:hypothetical protein